MNPSYQQSLDKLKAAWLSLSEADRKNLTSRQTPFSKHFQEWHDDSEQDVKMDINEVEIGTLSNDDRFGNAYRLTTTITEDMTPEEFDNEVYDDFQHDDGGRCGWTPLMAAAKEGNVPLINHLIDKYNADYNVCNDFGFTPLFAAVREKKTEAVQVLLKRGAKTLVFNKCHNGSVANNISSLELAGLTYLVARVEENMKI